MALCEDLGDWFGALVVGMRFKIIGFYLVIRGL